VRAAALAAVFFLAAAPARAELADPVVFDAQNAEVSLHGAAWKPASKNAALPAGTRLRTGGKGSVVLAFGPSLERVLALAEDTHVRLQGPAGTRLEEGRLFLLADSAGTAEGPLTVRAAGTRARLVSGGCQIDASAQGAVARVFGGTLAVAAGEESPVEVSEGYKLRSGSTAPARLVYDDYQDWQPWIRKFYSAKDDIYQDRSEKDLVR